MGGAHQGQRELPALRYHRLPKLTISRKLIFKTINPKSPSVPKVSNHARKRKIKNHQKNPTAQFYPLINGQWAKETPVPNPHLKTPHPCHCVWMKLHHRQEPPVGLAAVPSGLFENNPTFSPTIKTQQLISKPVRLTIKTQCCKNKLLFSSTVHFTEV